jgi:cytochrome c556
VLSVGSRAVAVALVTAIAATAVARAQQAAAPQGAAAPAAAKPIVPVNAIALTQHPDSYIGQTVTVSATVNQILSPSAFSVGQRIIAAKATGTSSGSPANLSNGGDVLVIAPILNEPVQQNALVTVVGELVRFDPVEIAKRIKGSSLQLPATVVDRYQGKPAIIAKAVVNSAMVDLAMRLPPPMSADEKALDDTMKKVGPSFAALRGNLDAAKTDLVSQNAAVLKDAFAQTEAFWQTKHKADAIKWAQDARAQLDAIGHAASSGEWDAAKKAATTLNQSCQACHTAYRERFDDGSYRIKVDN